jgi:hypothetical protein
MSVISSAERVAAAWSSAPLVVREFVADALKQASDAGVIVELSETSTVPYRTPDGRISEVVASGFFQDLPLPVFGLSLAGGWERSFPIFVHEFSHFQQWNEGSAVWSNLYAYAPDKDAVTFIDEWLAGANYPADVLAGCFRATRAVEMDCERRVLEHIARSNLPIDPESYAQKANAYVHFYHMVEKNRVWRRPDQAPAYEDMSVWPLAPATLTDPEVCPEDLAALLEKTYAPVSSSFKP